MAHNTNNVNNVNNVNNTINTNNVNNPIDRNNSNTSRLFYGWIVTACCCIMVFVTMGTVSNGLSIFMPYIMKAYALTNAQTSFLVTLRCLLAFVSMLFIGYYYDAIGYRLGCAIATGLCGLAYFTYSMADTYLVFCLGAAISGISYGLGSMIPVAVIMNRWFFKHRALAIGICGAGSGIAAIILPPILTGIIETESLKTALGFVAVYTILFAVIVFVFLRGTPADKGLDAYGRQEVYDSFRVQKQTRREESFTLSLKTWLLMGGVSLLMGAMANPGFMHLPVLYTSEGFRPMIVALIISIVGIVMTIFKVVFGQIADNLGGYRTSIIFFLILAASYIMCCGAMTGSVAFALVTAVVLGIGYPITTIGIPIWAGDFCSEDNYPQTVRKLQLTYAAGAMIFANLPGIMADIFGNYICVFGLFAALMLVATVLLVIAYKAQPSR